MSYLTLEDIRIEYEKSHPILDHFNLAVEDGELVSLLGPSGCGKTTTLRTVAGFIEPVEGTVNIAGRDVTRLPPNKRDLGIVFQSYALFPHLTVFQNVAFGLQRRRVSKQEQGTRVAEALALVDMAPYADRRPAQLSGGQRQRVAVARAIVIEPTLLLMDEPLSNLDAKLRVGMRTEIRRLQQRLGTTTLYVTHDHVEALTLSDQIVVMNSGKIEQIGPPEAVFARPATPFVADFMGFENRLAGRLTRGDEEAAPQVHVGEANWPATTLVSDMQADGPVDLYFRPEAASLSSTAQSGALPGEVLLRSYRGSILEYTLRTAAGECTVYVDDVLRFDEGDRVYITIPSQKLVVMPAVAEKGTAA
jgi:putative spermidine/putrescine transport system ATP-binding protein